MVLPPGGRPKQYCLQLVIYIYIYTPIFKNVAIRKYISNIHTCSLLYIYIYIRMRIHTYRHAYMHTHTHTHIFVLMFLRCR